MTAAGGANSGGTIFKITPAGALYCIACISTTTEGSNPKGSLIKGTDGNFYGTDEYWWKLLFGVHFLKLQLQVFLQSCQFNGATHG